MYAALIYTRVIMHRCIHRTLLGALFFGLLISNNLQAMDKPAASKPIPIPIKRIPASARITRRQQSVELSAARERKHNDAVNVSPSLMDQHLHGLNERLVLPSDHDDAVTPEEYATTLITLFRNREIPQKKVETLYKQLPREQRILVRQAVITVISKESR